jgi:hypothetical protein
MTLIALSVNHGYPIMMADLLISSTESDGVIETPTFVKGTGTRLTQLNHSKPTTLRQKLYIINDRLCVALGGRGDQMYTLLKRLKNLYGEVNFDTEEFKNYVENYPNEDETDLIAIILLSTKNEFDYEFSVLTIGTLKETQHEIYEKVIAGGSGTDQFLQLLNSKVPMEITDDLTLSEKLLVANQYIIGYWLGRESASFESLSNSWGAGYEMIVFKDSKFVKLEEYTVVLIYGKMGKEINFQPVPINTIMVNYEDNILVMRAFSMGIEKIFVIPAIDEMRTEIVLKKDPKHKTLVITYIFDNLDTNKQFFPTSVFPKNRNVLGETPVFIERVENKLRIYTDSNYDKSIYELILRQN